MPVKLLELNTVIHEFGTFAAFAEAFALNGRDLVFTSRRVYEAVIVPLGLACRVLLRDAYGAGEPTDGMMNALLRERSRLEAETPGGIHRVIAIGGGSILDMAKVLAVAPEGTEDVNDLYARPADLMPRHPLIALPTTCGTGSEVTNISVIYRSALGTKHGLVGDALYPAHAVLVPELLAGLPYHVFAASAIDALIHAMESYLSPLATPLTDVLGAYAMREILAGFRAVAADRGTLSSLSGQFLRASACAGAAFGNAGCGPVHALSFALGGKYHVPHGESCYQYLMPVLQYYRAGGGSGKLERLNGLLIEVLGGEDGFDALAELLERILPRKPMSAYGAVQADVGAFARSTMENQQRLLNRACVPLTLEAAIRIEQECL